MESGWLVGSVALHAVGRLLTQLVDALVLRDQSCPIDQIKVYGRQLKDVFTKLMRAPRAAFIGRQSTRYFPPVA